MSSLLLHIRIERRMRDREERREEREGTNEYRRREGEAIGFREEREIQIMSTVGRAELLNRAMNSFHATQSTPSQPEIE